MLWFDFSIASSRAGSLLACKNTFCLILHSPQDKIVSIKNAEELYVLAKHPKSFISLYHADHMLTRRKDSEYVASVISSWVSRYIENTDVYNETSSIYVQGNTTLRGKL